jgi:hypothetical protein
MKPGRTPAGRNPQAVGSESDNSLDQTQQLLTLYFFAFDGILQSLVTPLESGSTVAIRVSVTRWQASSFKFRA